MGNDDIFLDAVVVFHRACSVNCVSCGVEWIHVGVLWVLVVVATGCLISPPGCHVSTRVHEYCDDRLLLLYNIIFCDYMLCVCV
jgi:hypothetical protein